MPGTARAATVGKGLKVGPACPEEATKAPEAAVAAESFPAEEAAMARPATRVCRVVCDVAVKGEILNLGFAHEGEENTMHIN